MDEYTIKVMGMDFVVKNLKPVSRKMVDGRIVTLDDKGEIILPAPIPPEKSGELIGRDSTSITFAASNVTPAKTSPNNWQNAESAIRSQLPPKPKIESWSSTMDDPRRPGKKDLLIYKGNAFVDAVAQCFNEHRPLVMTPDMIWLLILQGVANHVNANSEHLRKKFVTFEGKETIVVVRDQFVKGDRNNPWENVFEEFSLEIKESIGDNYDKLMHSFSTTGVVEKAAFEVALMDVVQSYFTYEVHTMCGIPSITIEGEKKDWETILEKAKGLEEYELSWWLKELLPVLEQFVKASDGEIDGSFWKSFFNERGGSGVKGCSGHITKLFPYTEEHHPTTMVRNPSFDEDHYGVIGFDEFPIGLSAVPFIWKYYTTQYNMKFYAGFFGAKMDRELNNAIRPAIGWAITDNGKKGIEA